MIYILSTDHKECAKALDDKSLDAMIKDIALVLITVNYYEQDSDFSSDYFIKINPNRIPKFIVQWSDWARKCKANYLYLVELGEVCVYEHCLRQQSIQTCGIARGGISNVKAFFPDYTYHSSEPIIKWARENVPDLPACITGQNHGGEECTEVGDLPLVMPKKYLAATKLITIDRSHDEEAKRIIIIESYRNFYQDKLKQRKTYLAEDINED